MKRRELELNSALLRAIKESETSDGQDKDDNHMVIHWVQLVAGKKMMEALDVMTLVRRDEFARVHNRDSNNFMNESKLEHYNLKQTNNVESISLDCLMRWHYLSLMTLSKRRTEDHQKSGDNVDGIVIQQRNRF